jgi:dihydrofolate synthase/folylpolyglutamate synthase
VLDAVVLTNNGSPRALDTDSLYDLALPIFGDERLSVEPFLPDAVEAAIAPRRTVRPGPFPVRASSSPDRSSLRAPVALFAKDPS